MRTRCCAAAAAVRRVGIPLDSRRATIRRPSYSPRSSPRCEITLWVMTRKDGMLSLPFPLVWVRSSLQCDAMIKRVAHRAPLQPALPHSTCSPCTLAMAHTGNVGGTLRPRYARITTPPVDLHGPPRPYATSTEPVAGCLLSRRGRHRAECHKPHVMALTLAVHKTSRALPTWAGHYTHARHAHITASDAMRRVAAHAVGVHSSSHPLSTCTEQCTRPQHERIIARAAELHGPPHSLSVCRGHRMRARGEQVMADDGNANGPLALRTTSTRTGHCARRRAAQSTAQSLDVHRSLRTPWRCTGRNTRSRCPRTPTPRVNMHRSLRALWFSRATARTPRRGSLHTLSICTDH